MDIGFLRGVSCGVGSRHPEKKYLSQVVHEGDFAFSGFEMNQRDFLLIACSGIAVFSGANVWFARLIYRGTGPFLVFLMTFVSLLGFILMIIADCSKTLGYIGIFLSLGSIAAADHNLSMTTSMFLNYNL